MLRCNSPTRAQATSMSRFLEHRQTHTPGRTPLNESSARRSARYLHDKQTQETNIHALSRIAAIKQLQTYALTPTATGIG